MHNYAFECHHLVRNGGLKLGLIVPSSNTTMEPELTRALPDWITVHTSRIRLVDVDERSLVAMEEGVERAALELADAEVDLILFGCTTGSLIGGKGYDLMIADRITSVTGIRALTTSTAVLRALEAVNARRISVATPYIDSVNEAERRFLEENGFEVLRIRGLGILRNTEIGRVPPERVVELAKQAYVPGSDALFISCTNLKTFTVIGRLESELGKPVVTSNQASLWAALRALGTDARLGGLGKLLEDL
jgi:maleate isomerase